MTSIEHRNYRRRRAAVCPRFAQLWNWWTACRRCEKDHRELARLLDRMLRDIGLDHYIGSNRALTLSNLRLIALSRYISYEIENEPYTN